MTYRTLAEIPGIRRSKAEIRQLGRWQAGCTAAMHRVLSDGTIVEILNGDHARMRTVSRVLPESTFRAIERVLYGDTR